MTKEEAIRILKKIQTLYPKEEMSKEKIYMLIPILEPMDYKGVAKNLAKYVAANPFPPTMYDIAAYANHYEPLTEKIAKWREEADKVSPETKQAFREKMHALLREKSYEQTN